MSFLLMRKVEDNDGFFFGDLGENADFERL